MSVSLRIILVIASILVVFYVLRRIRKAKLKIEYSLFWIVFSFLLLIISIFPKIANFFAKICGIQSPVNFVFLFIILQIRRCICYVRKKMQEEDSRE